METTTKKQATLFESPIGLMILIEGNYIVFSIKKGENLCVNISGQEFHIKPESSFHQLEKIVHVLKDVIFLKADVQESRNWYERSDLYDKDDWDEDQDREWYDDEDDDWQSS